MQQTFLLPDLGEGLTEAEVVRWLVAEGDVVAVDQSVVEVETAKSLVEVPSPFGGRVLSLHATEGGVVGVGAPLITVGDAEAEAYREEELAGSGNVLIGYGTAAPAAAGRRRAPRVPAAVQTPMAPAPVPRVVSPLVRRAAREAGVDLGALAASDPTGVIRRADVERATVPAPPAEGHRVPMSPFRKAAAAALTRSRAEIPEATVWVDVDATPLWELRRAKGGPGLLAYVARFVVAGLKQYPVLNARVDADRMELVELPQVNLAFAVQSDRGLVVPAVLGADAMTTAELDVAIREVTAAAREGRATPEQLAAGTFTVNNYGALRVDGSAAIIPHPQVAMLGLGRIIDRPWVVDGELCVRKVAQLSFVFDHRVCDGEVAAGFMRVVADAMEDPASVIAEL
jgi:pyruvate dehydrogenase E2 component (dihydrolipoamide acetyltransferase)